MLFNYHLWALTVLLMSAVSYSDMNITVLLWLHLTFILLRITCSCAREHFSWNHSLVQVIYFIGEDTLLHFKLRRKEVFQSPTTEDVSYAVLWMRDYWDWCYRAETALLATAGGSLLRSLWETVHKSVLARPKLINRLTEELGMMCSLIKSAQYEG